MIVTSQHYMKKSTLAGVLFHLMFLGFIALALPKLFIIPFGLYLFVFALVRYFIAYSNESFTRYTAFFIYLRVSVAPLIAALGIAVFMHKHGFSLAERIFSMLSPAVIIFAAYIAIRESKPRKKIFRITRSAVGLNYPPSPPFRGIVALLGIITPLGGSLSKYENSEIIASGIAVILGLYIVFYHKDAIAGLRQLRAKERKTGIRYTFDNLEEIRKWRAKSWGARIFLFFYNKVGWVFSRRGF